MAQPIEIAEASELDPQLIATGRRLVAKATGAEPPELPTESPQRWIEGLATALPMPVTLPILEHLFGVMPVVRDRFDSSEPLVTAVEDGTHLTSLGLFTPNPEFSQTAAAIAGSITDGTVRLSGEVLVPSTRSDSTLVLVRVDGDDRLALVPHDLEGAEVGGARSATTSSQPDRPRWLVLENAEVVPRLVSEPLDHDPSGMFVRSLDAYAGYWTLAVSVYATAGVQALRRAARTTRQGGVAFNSAQTVSMDITSIEIEAGLLSDAVQGHFALAPGDTYRTPGSTLAAAGSCAVSRIATLTADLVLVAGLECGGPFTEPGARLAQTFLGGRLMTESALARDLGI